MSIDARSMRELASALKGVQPRQSAATVAEAVI